MNLEAIKERLSLRMGLTTAEGNWLISEVERLTADQGRFYRRIEELERNLTSHHNALLDAEAERDRLKEEVEYLQSQQDEAIEIAEASIRASIATGGTSCHWCMDKSYRQGAEAMRESAAKLAENYDNEYPGKLACGFTLRQWIANDIRALPVPRREE
jgi:hypothetical protein